MSSASELQRLSVVKEDSLNLPGCLPDLFIKMPDPEPYQGGVGKRILDALFASTYTTVDREALCEYKINAVLEVTLATTITDILTPSELVTRASLVAVYSKQ